MTIFAKALMALAISVAGALIAGFALRPYKSLFEPLGLTEPEWLLSACVGLLCGVAAAWKLARGSSARREAEAFFDAANGNHLG